MILDVVMLSAKLITLEGIPFWNIVDVNMKGNAFTFSLEKWHDQIL